MKENWSASQLPGYSSLSKEEKALIRKAYSEGRVDPTDFPAPATVDKPKEPEKAANKAEEEEAKEKEKAPEPLEYKIDVATRLAMCRSPTCMEKKVKIPVGDMRLGIKKLSTWTYKHWYEARTPLNFAF